VRRVTISPPSGPAPDGENRPSLRASDADRDRVAAVLGQALAEGRLTTAEHAERLDAAYTARTVAELAPLTADLPDQAPAGGVALPVERQKVDARFSKVIRDGRWVAGRHTVLQAMFGALVVDLSEAVLPGREITLELRAFCGKLILRLPPDAQVIDDGGAIFSKRRVSTGAPEGGAGTGPVIRIVGNARFAKVVATRDGAGWRYGWS
jgi:hypothetical protein